MIIGNMLNFVVVEKIFQQRVEKDLEKIKQTVAETIKKLDMLIDHVCVQSRHKN